MDDPQQYLWGKTWKHFWDKWENLNIDWVNIRELFGSA